jgi:hypothetical protein
VYAKYRGLFCATSTARFFTRLSHEVSDFGKRFNKVRMGVTKPPYADYWAISGKSTDLIQPSCLLSIKEHFGSM